MEGTGTEAGRAGEGGHRLLGEGVAYQEEQGAEVWVGGLVEGDQEAGLAGDLVAGRGVDPVEVQGAGDEVSGLSVQRQACQGGAGMVELPVEGQGVGLKEDLEVSWEEREVGRAGEDQTWVDPACAVVHLGLLEGPCEEPACAGAGAGLHPGVHDPQCQSPQTHPCILPLPHLPHPLREWTDLPSSTSWPAEG